MERTAMRNAIGIIEKKEQKRERERQRRRLQVYRRKAVMLAVFFLLCINAGSLMTNAFADEGKQEEIMPRWTSVRIQAGDRLWSIADRYAKKSPMTTEEYVEELKRMNGLSSDTIHAGNYLAVVYYE